jgi:hypothetical protein
MLGVEPWRLEMAEIGVDEVMRGVVQDAWKPKGPSSPGRKSDTAEQMRVTPSQRGWADPVPLESPPGIKHIDRMMKWQEDLDRAELVQRLAAIYEEKK